jgi:hypothetical protein
MWHDIKRLSYLSSSSSTYRQGEQAAINITHMTKPYMVSCSYTSQPPGRYHTTIKPLFFLGSCVGKEDGTAVKLVGLSVQVALAQLSEVQASRSST